MTDKSKASGDYDVGWGKPPQHSRFKKGQSGSPNGRLPKARNLKTDLVAELGARIRVREGDRDTGLGSRRQPFKRTTAARLSDLTIFELRGEWRRLASPLKPPSKSSQNAPHPTNSKTASRDPAAVRAPHPDIWRLWLPPMPSPGS